MDNNLVIRKRENRGNYIQDGNIWLERFSDTKIDELDEILAQVQCIDNSAFFNSDIEKIVIPENIQKIGTSAFRFCRNLKDVKLSSKIDTIPYSCFSSCYSLERIVIPEGVKSLCEDAFSECWGLKEVVLPSTLMRVGDRAFWGTQVKELNIPMGCVVNNNVLKHGIINYYEPNITPPPEPDCRTRIINRMILDYNYRLNMDRMAVAMQPKKMDEYEENMRFLKGLLDVKTK